MLEIIKQFILKCKYKKKVKLGRRVHINKQNFFEGNNSCADNSTIKYSKIGFGTYVGHNAHISWAKIGKYCSIAPNVSTVIGRHPLDFVSTHPAFFSNNNAAGFSYTNKKIFEDLKWLDKKSMISIGNDVWIGQSSMICDGTIIGDGAIIGAGSFVNQNIPKYSIAVGTPAKVIKYRFNKEDREFLSFLRWWDLPTYTINHLTPYFKSCSLLQSYIKQLEEDITVIIPFYNKEKYISKCIESIEKQIVRPSSIIIVDDCSPDNPIELIEELTEKNKNISYIRLEENHGVSYARNVGLKMAKTKYVTFIDADDYYYDNAKLLNEIILIKEHKENIIAYSQTIKVDDEENLISSNSKKCDFLEGDVYLKILSTWKSETIPRDYIIKRDLLIKYGGYDETKCLYEDLDLLLKISKDIPFYCTYRSGTAYRQVGNGLSSVNNQKRKIALNKIWKKNILELNLFEKISYYCLLISAKYRRFIRRKYREGIDL
ncbi:glycosyltransferase [Erysipelotrichaceae bacterium 66-17]|nr:hypothetical protein EROP_12170 [Erysipelotrichaceae bacterium OPF54]